MLAKPMLRPSDWPLRSAASWQSALVMVMLAAGFLSIAASQLALGLSLLLMLYRWFVQKERPPFTGLERTAAALALWALAMVPLSTNVAQSALYYRRFYLFAAIWTCAAAATTERRRGLMLAFFLGGALVTCLHDQVYQLFTHGSLFGDRMDVTFNSMTSGALLMLAALVALGFLLAPGVGRRLRLVMVLVLVPLLAGVAMTMTRSAELGLLAGAGVMLLVVRPRLFGIFAGVLLIAALVVLFYGKHFLPPLVNERLSPAHLLGGENTVLRREMWGGGWGMVKAHPWTGVGDRGLEELSRQYYTSTTDRYWGHLHSNIVHMAAIWGVPGLVFGQGFLLAGFWYLLKRWRLLRRHTGHPLAAGWTLGALGMWMGFFVAGLTEWYFGDAEPMLIYLAVLGIALGGGHHAATDASAHTAA
ncbi:MAG: O-antigen ligase family protein [bacterium]|nr:O-antigen ligase family protein [bacterium]